MKFLLSAIGYAMGDFKVPQPRQIGRRRRGIGPVGFRQRPLHVRLTGTYPDVPEENVLDYDVINSSLTYFEGANFTFPN